ncbi:MAG: DUF1579 domain-containing protein [Candidatus Omnitrophica bacterium]|nr:DUF1579 domain-containing protein [Candidatus Omnitrophota bacterium]
MKMNTVNDEQKELQDRMQEYSTPNKNHDVLKALTGNWKADVKIWMNPSGPQEFEGISKTQMILGGRFLEQTFHATMMGQPFEGRGIWGYNNLTKEYSGIWIDNKSTGTMISSGKYNSASKTLTEEGKMSCPGSQETNGWYKAVTTFKDANHYTYDSYRKDKDGKESKTMSITYNRS